MAPVVVVVAGIKILRLIAKITIPSGSIINLMVRKRGFIIITYYSYILSKCFDDFYIFYI